MKNNELFIAGQSAREIAEQHGTPLYVYNSKRIVEVYRKFYDTIKKNSDREIRLHYAMKTNSSKEILKLLRKDCKSQSIFWRTKIMRL